MDILKDASSQIKDETYVVSYADVVMISAIATFSNDCLEGLKTYIKGDGDQVVNILDDPEYTTKLANEALGVFQIATIINDGFSELERIDADIQMPAIAGAFKGFNEFVSSMIVSLSGNNSNNN